MATVLDRGIQALADVTGFIIDRTVTPEKVIGQAWVISKSRVVTLASRVANYSETPWALVVRFPHPDLTMGVKAMNFHPDFNKRAARDHYLQQLHALSPTPGIFENDICTLTLEAEIPEMQPDKVLELNRALSLPLQISANDLSGTIKPGDTGNTLQKALTSGRSGVLSFFDERKIPFARISIKQGKITRAVYNGAPNEFAVFELMWKKPGGNFVMQADDGFAWPNTPDVQVSTDQLAAEAIRRSQELPRLLDTLGGPNATFARTRPQLDVNQVSGPNRWVAERIWSVMDGYLPVSKMAERVQVDSYTAILALAELKGTGQAQASPGGEFHRSGQLAPPLVPASDLDLTVWDPIQGFYLDEHSGAPITVAGNYFGTVSLLNPRQLVHTIPFTQATHGAAVLKDGRLIGLHNGVYIAATAQNNPPIQLSQMVWIGSLADSGAKRLRSVEPVADTSDLAAAAAASGRGTLTGVQARKQQVNQALAAEDQPSSIPPKTGKEEPEILQKFTKVQILGAGGGMFGLGLILTLNSMMQPAPQPAAVPTKKPPQTAGGTTSGSTTSGSTSAGGENPAAPAGDVAAAIKVAKHYAMFKEEPFAPYVYENTAALAPGKLSFGLSGQNIKYLFIVWPQGASTRTVEAISSHLPFLEWTINRDKKRPIATGDDDDLYWRCGNYVWLDKEKEVWIDSQAVVGTFPSTQAGQSILFYAYPAEKKGTVDYQGIQSVVQRMRLTGGSSPGTEVTPQSDALASPEQVEAYINQIGESMKASFKKPEEAESARSVVEFGIGNNGNLTKLELKESSGIDNVDKALQKVVTANTPFPLPPKTRGDIMVRIILDHGELKVEQP